MLLDTASSSREAQLRVASMRLTFADLGDAPFNADPASGGNAAATRVRIQADEQSISRGLTVRSQPGVSPRLLAAGRSGLESVEPVVATIYQTALEPGGLAGAGVRVSKLVHLLLVPSATLGSVFGEIDAADAARAGTARRNTALGGTAAMLLLLAAFGFFYFRSMAAREVVEKLGREREILLGVSRVEARTDALTELGNRRALTRDLAGAIAEQPGSDELLLAMFDLDGFKQYNDSFGHGAGDALLQRLGSRLAAAAAPLGSAYRMGGDEFCMLARCSPDSAGRLLDDAITALQDSGETWTIGCSQGAVWMPSEAVSESEALRLADERMYANKASRSTAGQQVTDALLQVLTEQNAELDEHVERVSDLSGAVAEVLREPEQEVRLVRQAARLHDVGKTAIPAAILDKPGPLDEREWEFMRRHPLIGDRIVMAAPALANTAPLIRSSHERVDGHGYPDELAGQDIPMGSRIIAVCDAFDAMTSERSYRHPMEVDVALAELERHAGTQFDASVVAAFLTLHSLHHSPAKKSCATPVGA